MKTSLTPYGWLLAFLAVITITTAAFFQIGCAPSQSYTYTPSGSATLVTITGFGAWCENNLPIIRSATKSSVLITSKVLTAKGISTVDIAGDVHNAGYVLEPLLGQSEVSPANIDSALATVSVKDSSGIYADAISPAIDLVAGYIVQLKNEGAPAKVSIDVLTALIGGLNDASASLNPATTMFHLSPNRDIRPRHGWLVAYNVY